MKKTLATALLAGISATIPTTATANAHIDTRAQAQTAIFSEVSQHFHTIRALSIQADNREQAHINAFFASLEKMAVTVEKLNTQTRESLEAFTLEALPLLEMAGELISAGIDLAKQCYKEEILNGNDLEHRRQFRALTSANFRFSGLLRELRERLQGVEIVSIEGLNLTVEDISKMNEALAKAGGAI